MLLPWAVPALAASAIWQVAVRRPLRLRQLGAGRASACTTSRTTPGSPTATQRLRGDLRDRRLAVVPVHRAQPAGRAADAAAGDAARRRASTAPTAWQRFRLVTLPLLRPIIAVLVIFSTIWDFKIFDQVYVMAAGRARTAPPTPPPSPPTARASRSATTARGAAIAVVLFLVLLVFSLALRAADRQGGRRHEVAAASAAGCTCAMIAISAFALFPVYWVVITSLKPRQRDLHAHAGPVAERPAVGPVPARARRGPRRPRAAELADRRQRARWSSAWSSARWRPTRSRASTCRSRASLLMLVLMTQMFPLVVLVIPLFVMMRKAGPASAPTGPGHHLPGVHACRWRSGSCAASS